MPKDSEYRVLRVKNISKFDFTGELGARYGGRDFVIPAGKSLLAPYHLAHHLAKHLARQIMLQKAPKRTEKELNGRGADRPIWDEQSIADLKQKILVEEFTEDRPAPKSEADRMVDRVSALNKQEKEHEREQGGNTGFAGTVDENPTSVGEITFRDKATVIADLEKKGVKFNPRDSKETLEALLK